MDAKKLEGSSVYSAAIVGKENYEAIGILTDSVYFLKLRKANQNGGCDICEAFRQLEERGERRGIEIGE